VEMICFLCAGRHWTQGCPRATRIAAERFVDYSPVAFDPRPLIRAITRATYGPRPATVPDVDSSSTRPAPPDPNRLRPRGGAVAR